MNQVLSKEQFQKTIEQFHLSTRLDFDFLYDVYESTFVGLVQISENKEAGKVFEVNSHDIIFYLLGEYLYSTSDLNEEHFKEFIGNEKYKESMSSVIADKYISLSIYNHNETKLTNKFFPPISSIDLYINLMLNICSTYPLRDKTNGILVDFLTKTLSIARCIVNLLCDGYETEAFAMWRTLHECECVLIILDKYRNEVIQTYVKHMQYGLIYRMGEDEDETHKAIFAQLKEEMKKLDLKSKDTKKYIEYGWLLSVPGHEKVENFKLNFRDGVETLAGLHRYSETYVTSSEILHGTPLLIYSNKRYFHLLTLVNLYESFFRIEGVFQSLFFVNITPEAKKHYLEMKQLYFSQLLSIHHREQFALKNLNKK